MTWPARLSSYALLVLLVLLGLGGLDALTAPLSEPVSAPPLTAAGSHMAPGRVFVLLIDSLRYQTAISALLMPKLSRLRAHAAYGRVTPTRDAVTVPCVRAAFTGRDRTRVLGFVANFLKGNAGIESIFTQLSAAGRRGAAYSDGAFNQFGVAGIDRRSNGDPEPQAGETQDRRDHVDEQNATVPLALADFRSGKHDLVVMHITYTDHVAHEVGIDAPLYAQRYATADALVAQLDSAIPATDTLVVMGDHGHDARGRHALGLQVPTFALYRGPGFVAASNLGNLSIRDHRYLMGYALGLPLPADYDAGRYPAALLARDALPADYAQLPRAHELAMLGVPAQRRGTYAIGVLGLSALLLGWMLLTAARSRDLAVLLPWRRRTLLSLLSAALGFCALGASFPSLRRFVHEPSYSMLALLWAACFGLAAALVRMRRDLRHAWVLVAAPLLLSFPTVYRYGAPATMGPAWLGWLLCLALGVRQWAGGDPDASPTAVARSRSWWLVAVLLVLLLVPFAALESSNFRFDEWVLWPVAALPQGFLYLSLLAKLVVFIAPRAPRSQQLAGLAAALLLAAAQLGLLPASLQLTAVVSLLAVAVVLRLQPAPGGSPSDRSLQLAAAVTGVLLLHHATVRIPPSAYYWQDCLLAAVVLSARLSRELPAQLRAFAWALILFFAFFAAGWVSFAWTVHQLEWGFLYDWLSAAFVEKHVLLLLPLILGRYLLPIVAARCLLARELGSGSADYPYGLARLLVGGKVASLLLWTCGIAYVNVTSDLYLEAAQQTGIAVVLWAGLL